MNLVTRAMNMLKSPKTEWDVVAAEQATVGSLYTGYAIPLSLIAAVAGFLGSSVFASSITSALGMHFGMSYWLVTSLAGWVLGLVGVYIAAFVVNMLASNFSSTPNLNNALKLVIFAYTAIWVASIATIIPVLGGIVAIAGMIYSIYLFYLGMPKLMGTPKEKEVMYMCVSAIIIVVIMVVVGMLVGAIAGAVALTSNSVPMHY